MAPAPRLTPTPPVAPSLGKRGFYRTCDYGDESCEHYRSAVIAIVAGVIFLKLIILFLIIRQCQKRRDRRECEESRRRGGSEQDVAIREFIGDADRGRYGSGVAVVRGADYGEEAPPPPYLPREPERAVVPGGCGQGVK